MSKTIREVDPSKPHPIEVSKKPDAEEANAKEKPQKPHAIETHHVGLPGQETLVAETTTGDQVNVRQFDQGSVLDIKRAVIEQVESDALTEIQGKEITDIKNIAKKAIEASDLEAEDVGELLQLLEEKQDMILLVDKATIDNPSIPQEGLHLLIPKNESQKLMPHIENFGYTIKEIGDMGIKAEKGNSKLIFMYAGEKAKKAT